jgi:hypothetical protein
MSKKMVVVAAVAMVACAMAAAAMVAYAAPVEVKAEPVAVVSLFKAPLDMSPAKIVAVKSESCVAKVLIAANHAKMLSRLNPAPRCVPA